MTLSTAAYPVAVFFVGEGISGGTARHFSKKNQYSQQLFSYNTRLNRKRDEHYLLKRLICDIF